MALACTNENTTSFIQLDFKDQADADVNPDSATYTLYDANTLAVINSRSNVAISSPTSGMLLRLEVADNVILNDETNEEKHVLYVKFSYTVSGVPTVGSDEFPFNVVNLPKES
jgi:hypothetical protein